MTLHDYMPGDYPPVPDLPVLPIGALVVGTGNLLGQAADLPQPRAITIYDELILSLEFDPSPPSLRAITRWALRFGAVLVSEPHQCDKGTFTYCHAEFSYHGVAVTAYALIPDAECVYDGPHNGLAAP